MIAASAVGHWRTASRERARRYHGSTPDCRPAASSLASAFGVAEQRPARQFTFEPAHQHLLGLVSADGQRLGGAQDVERLRVLGGTGQHVGLLKCQGQVIGLERTCIGQDGDRLVTVVEIGEDVGECPQLAGIAARPPQ